MVLSRRAFGHVIEYILIEGGAFFPALYVPFHDGLNAFIGEFGTGKTGIFHYVAYAIGAAIVLPDPAEHEKYLEDTLGTGRITVGIRTEHGVRYKVVRSRNEPRRVYAEDGSLADVSLDGDLFKIRVYGAGALVAIAKDPKAQLDLIDGFAESDIRRLTQEIAIFDRGLKENATQRRHLAIEIEEDAARAAELASVTETLKGLGLVTPGISPEVAARTHERTIARGRERTAIAALTKEIRAAGQALEAFTGATLRRLSSTVEADLERGEHGPVFRRAHEAVARVAGAVGESAEKLRESLRTGEAEVQTEENALAVVHAAEEEAYRTLVIAEDADRARSVERDRLRRRFEEVSAAAKRLADRRRELDERVKERDALRAQRTLAVRERWAIRDRIAKDLTEQLTARIRVTVALAADVWAYAELLADLLRGSSVREEVIKAIARSIRPSQLVKLVETGDAAPIEEVDPSKTQKPARAQKILEALRDGKRLDELETVALGDVALIELAIGEGYQPSARVSLGQCCTAILPILLLQSNVPLLIDQPEDNLHNKFIFERLVPSLLEIKLRRQLIFATHNANLVVLGSADRVNALVIEEGRGKLGAAGDVDEMREWIEGILEGGRKAFLLRWERYRRSGGDK